MRHSLKHLVENRLLSVQFTQACPFQSLRITKSINILPSSGLLITVTCITLHHHLHGCPFLSCPPAKRLYMAICWNPVSFPWMSWGRWLSIVGGVSGQDLLLQSLRSMYTCNLGSELHGYLFTALLSCVHTGGKWVALLFPLFLSLSVSRPNTFESQKWMKLTIKMSDGISFIIITSLLQAGTLEGTHSAPVPFTPEPSTYRNF